MLKDKIAIVTGGSQGIGAATVKAMRKEGAIVIIADINKPQESDNELKDSDFIKTDVSDHNSVKSLIESIVSNHGRLDILVNNAGIGNKHFAKTAEHTLEDWENVIAINQSGVFYGMKYALQQMMKQGHGNIVNVSSLAGIKASGNNIAYSASKFAVVGMTKSAALEYARKNIRINCVCPGYTQSDLLNQLLDAAPNMNEKLLKYMPMNRFGKSSEIAEAILWLASDKSSFTTGQAMIIGGGSSL